MKKRIKILFLTLLLSVSFLAVGNLVLAQEVDVTGLGVVDEGIALGATDPRIVAARIIQIALGFLGIIAVGLIIYGGWMYMTSEGNEEKITKAKNILKAAVIGLIIILSAFGIASFVISRLLGATGVTTGDRCIDGAERSCGCGGIQVCSGESWGACVGSSCDIMGGINFFIRSTNPRDNETNAIRNVKISAFLNRSLGNVEDLADNFKVEKIGEISEESGDPIDFGPVEINGSISAGLDDSVIYFQADSSCEFLGQTIENCLDAWSRFRVTINESRNLIDANRQKLNEGAPYIFEFNTKSDIDIGDPIAGIVPTQICVDDGSLKPDANLISGWARDDYGLNSLVFYQAKIGEDFALEYYNSAEGVKFYSTRHKYDTSNMIAGDEYIFRVEAEDVAGQYGRADFQTIVRPGHCCNGIQDGNEEDVDCGGSCLSCVGGPCNVSEPNQCGEGASNCSDNLCSTFFCDCKGADGCICERKPIIDWISPSGGFCENNKDQPCQSDDDCGANGPCDQSTPNAKNGNLVSIGGRNFGTYDSDSSKVYFGNAEAKLASSVNDKCDNSWTDRQIIVVVPAGIASSSIMVEGSNGFSDSTGDNYGAPIPDFVVTGFDRPGLCKLNPSEGAQDDRITYYGLGLTESSAFFGSRSSNLVGTNQNNVSNQEISALVPSIRNGLTSSFVKTKIGDVDVESNYLDFTKKPSTSGPQIFSFDPVIGNVGQYVTIRGKGFGANQGNSTVSFGDNGADYNFPLVCATSLWSDKQVIVKVPEGISDGDYLIEMNVGNNTIDSSLLNPAKFKASSTLPLAPGICKIDPKSGLFGKAVSLWGEYFGSAQGDVKFSNNKDSDSISFWNKDSSVTTSLQPDKAIASVPQGAQSGPVQVISSDNRESNKMDFLVGSCLQADDPDDVCGDGVCCPAGTFAEGECKADNDDCYFTPKNSVYEFEFSTGKETTSNGGGPDDNGGNNFSCSGYGTACSSNYLCPNSPGRCSPYEGGQEVVVGDCSCEGVGECTAGNCSLVEYNNISARCVFNDFLTKADISQLSIDDVCYVDLSNCAEAEKSNTWKEEEVLTGKIIDAYYLDKHGFMCSVDFGFNEYGTAVSQSWPVINEQSWWCGEVLARGMKVCDLATTTMFMDANNENFVSAYCKDEYWHIDAINCPTGWSKVGAGGVCKHNTETCSFCPSDYDCIDDLDGDYKGVCGVDKPLCADRATCDVNTEKCVKQDKDRCDCCCEIGQSARDCCYPLTCTGKCGAESADVNGVTVELGSCSGCALASDPDLACNCTGHSGKYCDTSDENFPTGVCRDCTQISTQSECSKHSTCCVDARRDNVCRGSVGENQRIAEGNIQYCPYYKCEGNNCVSSKVGDYTSSNCNNMCGATPPGKSCYDGNRATCTLDCVNSYNCMGPDDSCLCCCDPENDQCEGSLVCQPDKYPCTGTKRGLCCGCSSDNQCGSLESVGCGSDACCRPRPKVDSVKPEEDAKNICRNAQISATFDSLMDVSSFSGNVIVVGDYGFGQCPGDTQYLVLDGQEHKPRNILARTYLRIKKSVQATIAFILSPIRSEQAYADNSPSPDHNYCAIRGAVSGIHNTVAATSTLVFSPNQLLDPGRDYFVIIKGDTELDSKQGVRSDYKVGMKGPDSDIFNGINFSNAYIWKFTTLPDQGPLNSGICEVERVEISPSSYLFKTNLNDLHENDIDPGDDSFDKVADKDKVFTAMAMSSDNQVLVPVGGYMWDWGWRIENNQVVATSSVFADNAERQFVKVETTLVDAKTKLSAEVKFKSSENQIFSENKTGEANVYVFLCENPWPTSTSDNWSPWRDTDQTCIDGDCLDTNFELYYCRDAGGHGTADDLPALAGESVVRGSSDGIIKEAYLFRAGVPVVGYGSDTPFLSGLVKPQGKTVSLSWNKVNSILKYKIYYGRNSRAYTNSILVELSTNDPEQVAYEVSNLDNGIDYYFAVTAISAEGAESKYSNEIKLKPWDSMGPVMPTLSSLTRENNNVKIEWSWSDTSNPDDAKTFRLHYRFGGQCNEDTVFPAFKEIQKNETVLLDISNLEDNVSVCVGLNAYDQYGNPSDTIIEQWPLIEETPDEDSTEDENAENNDEASE